MNVNFDFSQLENVVNVDLGLLSDNERLIQQLNTMFATNKLSSPHNREFGIDYNFIDKPINLAQTLIKNEIAKGISSYFSDKIRLISVKFIENTTQANIEIELL